ncbi:hypothetical protein Tco_1467942 [Tanacetum coccineum]
MVSMNVQFCFSLTSSLQVISPRNVISSRSAFEFRHPAYDSASENAVSSKPEYWIQRSHVNGYPFRLFKDSFNLLEVLSLNLRHLLGFCSQWCTLPWSDVVHYYAFSESPKALERDLYCAAHIVRSSLSRHANLPNEHTGVPAPLTTLSSSLNWLWLDFHELVLMDDLWFHRNHGLCAFDNELHMRLLERCIRCLIIVVLLAGVATVGLDCNILQVRMKRNSKTCSVTNLSFLMKEQHCVFGGQWGQTLS